MKESWLRNNEKYNVKNDGISTNNGGDSIKQLSSNWESIILPPDVAFTSLKKVKANNDSKGSAGSNTQQRPNLDKIFDIIRANTQELN